MTLTTDIDIRFVQYMKHGAKLVRLTAQPVMVEVRMDVYSVI
jgi:hypothetical protein